MEELHLAQIIRKRIAKYGNLDVFRFKSNGAYKSISWNQFKDKADAVSKFLISEGLECSSKIGIYSQNYPEWTICDLAILSIRGVVVPIYATSNYNQLEYIVNETEMELICVGDEIQLIYAMEALNKTESLKRIITFNCEETDDDRVISINNIYKQEFNESAAKKLETQLVEANIDDLATIIYTSGTTGEPKGVMLNHSNFVKLLEIHDQRLQLNESDVSVAFLPLSHVFERAWTYFVLHSGATNVYNVNTKEIMNELPVIKPTVMCSVPRLFEKTYEGVNATTKTWSKAQQAIFNWALNVGLNYIEYEKESRPTPIFLRLKHTIANTLVMKKFRKIFGGNIKYMPCAGAAMNMDILRFFHALGIKINYGYGATETTATVSCMRNDKYDFVNTGSIMPDVQVKIKADDGQILVKGDTVFKGYFKKPKATAEALVDGWYHTGDQGEIPAEGTLLMKERIKDIIKTSTGKFISPQKIELLLSNSNLIDQICIIGDNRKYLVALIVPAFNYIKMGQTAANKNPIIISDPMAIDMVQKSIDELQKDLPSFEKVVKFKLLSEPFTIDNNLMTNSLKIKRKQVAVEYATLIEAMYSS